MYHDGRKNILHDQKFMYEVVVHAFPILYIISLREVFMRWR